MTAARSATEMFKESNYTENNGAMKPEPQHGKILFPARVRTTKPEVAFDH
jgi:hypothetical protein